jgi:hypothetical protein
MWYFKQIKMLWGPGYCLTLIKSDFTKEKVMWKTKQNLVLFLAIITFIIILIC